MIPKKEPSYLFKSSNGIFYFRTRIPISIRIRYNTPRKEIRKSLNTRDITIALRKARYLWVIMEITDYTMKDFEHIIQEDNYGRKLLKNFLLESLKLKSDSYLQDMNEESRLNEFLNNLSSKEFDLFNKQLDKWNSFSKEMRDNELELLKNELESTSTKGIKQTSTNTNSEQGNLNADLVSEKIKEFLTYHFDRKQRSGKPAPVATIEEYEGIYKEFLSIIGNNLKCCELNKDIIKNYENAIWSLPSNHTRRPKYRNIEIKELLKMETPKDDKKSVTTFNKHAMRVKTFLKWAEHEEYIAAGLESFIEHIPDTAKANIKTEPFSNEELAMLFNHEVYERGIYKHPSRYWLPLLALFTGARGKELAQLYKDDINVNKDTGIYFINIRENLERNQRLKNSSAQRLIPIHSRLLKLGFLDFVRSCKKESMLFPELDNKTGKYFKKFGNNFSRKNSSGWKWKCGVKRENTKFHSFRHNVIDFLVQSNARKIDICSFAGHKYKGQGIVPNYVKATPLKMLQKTVNSLKFPSINWEKINKLKW